MEKKLIKSSNKMLAGVCGGIAEYFGWEVTLTRIGYMLMTIFSAAFPGIILYLAMALIMPKE
jgi:phage shock protein C